MEFNQFDVIQYYNSENSEGLYWQIYIIREVLNTVVITDKGLRLLKENVVVI